MALKVQGALYQRRSRASLSAAIQRPPPQQLHLDSSRKHIHPRNTTSVGGRRPASCKGQTQLLPARNTPPPAPAQVCGSRTPSGPRYPSLGDQSLPELALHTPVSLIKVSAQIRAAEINQASGKLHRGALHPSPTQFSTAGRQADQRPKISIQTRESREDGEQDFPVCTFPISLADARNRPKDALDVCVPPPLPRPARVFPQAREGGGRGSAGDQPQGST